MINSWNIEAEVQASSLSTEEVKTSKSTSTQDPFAGMRGMWAGRDIDDKKLRELAWGTNKRRPL
jgi:hypothetical protein